LALALCLSFTTAQSAEERPYDGNFGEMFRRSSSPRRGQISRSAVTGRQDVRYQNIAALRGHYDELGELHDFAADALHENARAVAKASKPSRFLRRYNGCKTVVAGIALANQQSHDQMMRNLLRFETNPFLYMAPLRHVPIDDPARAVTWDDLNDLSGYLNAHREVLTTLIFLANFIVEDRQSDLPFDEISYLTLDRALKKARRNDTVNKLMLKLLTLDAWEVRQRLDGLDQYRFHRAVLEYYLKRVDNDLDPIPAHPTHSAFIFQVLQVYGPWD